MKELHGTDLQLKRHRRPAHLLRYADLGRGWGLLGSIGFLVLGGSSTCSALATTIVASFDLTFPHSFTCPPKSHTAYTSLPGRVDSEAALACPLD
jgi:hypothetical protein